MNIDLKARLFMSKHVHPFGTSDRQAVNIVKHYSCTVGTFFLGYYIALPVVVVLLDIGYSGVFIHRKWAPVDHLIFALLKPLIEG